MSKKAICVAAIATSAIILIIIGIVRFRGKQNQEATSGEETAHMEVYEGESSPLYDFNQNSVEEPNSEEDMIEVEGGEADVGGDLYENETRINLLGSFPKNEKYEPYSILLDHFLKYLNKDFSDLTMNEDIWAIKNGQNTYIWYLNEDSVPKLYNIGIDGKKYIFSEVDDPEILNLIDPSILDPDLLEEESDPSPDSTTERAANAE